MQFPSINLSISSPMYMHRHEKLNPLSDFKTAGTYRSYVAEVTNVYRRVSERLAESGRLVIEVANLKGPEGVTTLAWDLGIALAEELAFQGELVINWDRYGYGYEHSYCLLFGKDDGARC